MKVSYNILNTYFEGKLPNPSVLENAFTFHSWEIDEVIEKDGDTIFDVKVLPDKSAWALSHRGIAKDLSVVLNLPLAHDPFAATPTLLPKTDALQISIHTPQCTRYIGAHIQGVKIGPSPEWLRNALQTLGQRSINNVVDATNYVMVTLGQPLHAFDAKKLEKLSIGVRMAREGEQIITLTGESYVLSSEDMLIVDGTTDLPIGVAGIKGGKHAEVTASSTDLIIESAHFDAVSVRKSSQRLKLRTDASQRYENGVVPETTAYGIEAVVKLILEVAGGSFLGYRDTGYSSQKRESVSVSLSKINSVLGLSLSKEVVDSISIRFGYGHSWNDEVLTVAPPFERPDLVLPEDLIEEIGRVYGYDHVESVTPEPLSLSEMNTTFYYSDRIRVALQDVGFSEVFTSSFRAHDEVALKNALASDKGYLRSTLSLNLDEALARNAPLSDLLGVTEVRIFEVGTVFKKEGQVLALALGVRSPGGYKAKKDDAILAIGIEAVEKMLGMVLTWKKENGIAETILTEIIGNLPVPTTYAPFVKTTDSTYKPFSLYPFASRDVAFWSGESVSEEEWEVVIRDAAGPLLARLDLFDRFEKEGRVSCAFRLVFQSYEKTLTEEEINALMENVYAALKGKGAEIR